MSLMSRRHPAIVDSSLMTWCRDLKDGFRGRYEVLRGGSVQAFKRRLPIHFPTSLQENYCYVSPPGRGCMRSRLAAGDDYGIRPVEVTNVSSNGFTWEACIVLYIASGCGGDPGVSGCRALGLSLRCL